MRPPWTLKVAPLWGAGCLAIAHHGFLGLWHQASGPFMATSARKYLWVGHCYPPPTQLEKVVMELGVPWLYLSKLPMVFELEKQE